MPGPMRSARAAAALLAALCLAAAGCSRVEKKSLPPNLPVHTLVYGGDVTLGRQTNPALFDDKERARLFGDVAPLLEKADVALVNGEGVISSGGEYFDKGEPRPYMYRAHPSAIEPFVAAGVDVVTVGNNHSGDYGPLALREMLDILTLSKIGYTGGGYDGPDAETPYYQKVGDTVVAIIGGDFTNSESCRAKKDKPGSLYFNAFNTAAHHGEIVRTLTRLIAEARRHAHLVFLTPHWGDNWKEAPDPNTRALAKKIIAAGCDGILGHSAHWFQGVELIDGKPVIYDAGNLTVDYGGGDRAHDAFLWKLAFNKAGVVRIEGLPLTLGMNTVNLAKGKKAEKLLEKVVDDSDDLGTPLRVEGGAAVAELSPDEIREPKPGGGPPSRSVPKEVRRAPSDTIIDALPASATPLGVRYGDGVELLGYELVNTALHIPKGGAFIALYWRKSGPLTTDYAVRLEGRLAAPNGKTAVNYMNHTPGDWILPVAAWPEGKVIRDWTLFRLTFQAEGTVAFFAGLLTPKGKLVAPQSSDAPLSDGGLVPVGKAAYAKDALPLFQYWKTYREKNPL
jgi:poly-gamma-glutamate capsule biosynthesis protein CapA/YwtB (metallophosphatase superfamily)